MKTVVMIQLINSSPTPISVMAAHQCVHRLRTAHRRGDLVFYRILKKEKSGNFYGRLEVDHLHRPAKGDAIKSERGRKRLSVMAS